jgi:hypothetical protein
MAAHKIEFRVLKGGTVIVTDLTNFKTLFQYRLKDTLAHLENPATKPWIILNGYLKRKEDGE